MTKPYIVLDIETTGLNPWYGDKITCICAKHSNGVTFSKASRNEDTVLTEFWKWYCEIVKRDDISLVTKNGKMFDVPFLIARSCANRIAGTDRMILLASHFDLQEITQKRVSLQDMATLMKCTPKSGTGLDAIKLFHEGKLQKLKKYCMQDVETTEEIYLKWRK